MIYAILIGIIFLMARHIDNQSSIIKQLEEYRKKDQEYSDYQQTVIDELDAKLSAINDNKKGFNEKYLNNVVRNYQGEN